MAKVSRSVKSSVTFSQRSVTAFRPFVRLAPASHHVAAVLSLSPSCASLQFAHSGIALYEYRYDDDDTNKSYIEKTIHGTMYFLLLLQTYAFFSYL